jgi:hypothetical protein
MDNLDSTTWRTSTYSGTNGNCVEVGSTVGIVRVRDTQDRDGVALSIPGDAWASFTISLK